ncbi:hypothetical protein [Streptomyces fuscichromogenes]|uniref:Uncharacterized protein n=1 Tax=Streptomyces fuscichromogenes TaxID=1324013 RepID=A0A917XNN0_9ACTN|nr:hypothetical protein [Streptomyces fuscichromogenes]GGN44401.1 hypothetical protein GCM10011578_095280 [Streptomyces fuscichromogenes]
MAEANDPSAGHPPQAGPLSSDRRSAQLAEAFRDALIRMRDGKDLTAEDLDMTTDLLERVQAANGVSLAAAIMPMLKEVFQDGRQGYTPEAPTVLPASGPAPMRRVRTPPEPRWW